MELTGSLVEEKADEYRDVEPLYSVETEHVEMLRGTFASGEYGWRDAEWVVQWYFRRYLGAYPDPPSRAAYLTYQETCRGLCERFDVDAWTLYRALWRLWSQVEENSH